MPDSNARVVAATAVALGAAACVLASRWARCVLRRRASVELLYFNISGLGEPIRLALTLAGQPFVDRRVSFDEFQQLKPTLRFGQVPCLVVDGVELFQSAAILRYVGQAFDPSGAPRRESVARVCRLTPEHTHHDSRAPCARHALPEARSGACL